VCVCVCVCVVRVCVCVRERERKRGDDIMCIDNVRLRLRPTQEELITE
jgi:hypothetical protein